MELKKAAMAGTVESSDAQINAKVSVVDKGALDCTLKARVEGAVFRSVNEDPDTPNPWEVL